MKGQLEMLQAQVDATKTAADTNAAAKQRAEEDVTRAEAEATIEQLKNQLQKAEVTTAKNKAAQEEEDELLGRAGLL